ncbi:unnamed protein product [Menidia menidia]|uniref:(Atlantic silverside) hypothetical protein n=1 Tax=Menidia menidia TaxID=238744 RepID=A0A8S4ANE1_9TELE|nr:unnamed protein product [Menidia menidia]
MDAGNKNQERQHDDALSENFDDFKYEEVFLEDEWSLTEGEEDLEATVKAIQDRAQASARAPQRPNARANAHPTPSVIDFLRSFLFENGMSETLDIFETEWTEMAQKGLVAGERVDVVPDIYTENQRLERELKNARRDREDYRKAASVAAETLVKVQRARDNRRLHHMRVVQEKNRLIAEIKKLKSQCDSYGPVVKRMNEKYQTVLKQAMMLALEMDKAHVDSRSERLDSVAIGGGEKVDKTRVRETVTQPRPPASPGRPGRPSRVHSVRASAP